MKTLIMAATALFLIGPFVSPAEPADAATPARPAAVTSTPASATKPATTKKSTATKKSTVAKTTVTTKTPAPTKKPTAAQAPATTKAPATTTKRTAAKAPTATQRPVTTKALSPTKAPAPSTKPVTTKKPVTTAASSNPSGVGPPAAIAGYTAQCIENFSKSAPMGSWGTKDAAAVVYRDGCAWTSYPDGWPSTYTSGAPGYAPSQVLSVHDGMLDYFLHPINGHAQGANPSPILATGSRYQAYGKYIMRMRADRVPGYVMAMLLWPKSDADWQFAESDFPEMKLTDPAAWAFHHYGGAGKQDAYSQTIDVTQWHTYEQEWSPGRRSYYIDGKLIGTSTNAVHPGISRWQLQVEPTGSAAGGTGHLQIDWVAVYSRD